MRRIWLVTGVLILSGLACSLPAALTAPTAAVTPATTAAPDAEETAPAAEIPLEATATVTVMPSAEQAASWGEVSVRARDVLRALQSRDGAALAQMVHPQKGLRFSPYAFVRSENLVFQAEVVAGLWQDTTRYTWGAYDGSGLPIEATFAEYSRQFVYSDAFDQADVVSVNKAVGQGNSINNAAEFYPGAVIVEFYLRGKDPKYQGMDWKSLRMVFEQTEDGEWYLVGLIHDQWTI